MIERTEQRVKLTKKLKSALTAIVTLALENSCSCGSDDPDVNPETGKGWNGHDAGCWVDRHSKEFDLIIKEFNLEL